ncbi:MAG: serine/threonine-protein kinase [Gemmatimonadetes bacterium]|nr:serine/threonine-protein kinase [Gemmatimonadota bacterium]
MRNPRALSYLVRLTHFTTGAPLQSGTIVGDQYEVLEKMGEGGMGIIFRARDTKLDRLAALKTLSAHLVFDEDAKRRFVQEAQAASALDHANICTVHDIGETAEGKLFIVMTYYEGHTLKHRMEESRFSIEECLELGIQLSSALERAHEAGIVHRDLKPSNVQITDRGEAKLLDFGVAKLSSREPITHTGVSLGTVGYASPEQVRAVDVDHRADLWALGALLYEMLAGQKAFDKSTGIATTTAVLHGAPEPLLLLQPETPPDVVWVINACLEKDPANRPPDARTVRKVLQRAKAIHTGEYQTVVKGASGGADIARNVALGVGAVLAAGVAIGFLVTLLSGAF